jgi:alpha-mannosidase
MKEKTLFLVCNAHLDPVWLWEWQEGAGEALSTFRTAAQLCEEFEEFVFSHNESLLYQWIEEYEPELFARIQELVKKKKWHILGGWYIQPDCNMPAGESFVRQILIGRSFSKKGSASSPKQPSISIHSAIRGVWSKY